MAYDSWNRLASEIRHVSQDDFALSYEYDEASRLTALTYPDNMVVLYSHDDLNRTTEIRRYVDGSNDEILMDNIQYTSESLITQFDYGNGLRSSFSFDSKDRLSTIDVEDGETSYLDLDFTWDNNSNVSQIVNGWRDVDTDWHTETESYGYDGLDRLVTASCGSWSHAYSYDKAGNRISADSVTYTVNAINEITALSDGTSFMYDSNGNRTEKTKGTDTWVYTYDSVNRLTEVEKNSVPLGEYAYDGGGRRIQKTEDDITTTYVYSGAGVMYEENSVGIATYIYGPTGRIAKRTTIDEEATTFYYHSDQSGSTRLVTDEEKNIVSSTAYHPFGESHLEEGDESYLFVGKERDSTGLYYFGARYYDCETGTFITRDPVAGEVLNPQSFNQYIYCQNNPLKYVDPWGLEGRKPSWQDVDQPTPCEREKKGSSGGSPDSLGDRPEEFWYHDDLPYNGGWLFLITPVFCEGNVGVAIGYYGTANLSAQSQRIYDNNGYGLVVFIFDDEGNLITYYFIPSTDFDDPERMKYWRDFLRQEFSTYGINPDDFQEALEQLRIHCHSQAESEGLARWFGGDVGGACLAALLGGGVVGAAGGALFALAVFLTVRFWHGWEDTIAAFKHFMTKYE